MNKWMNKLQAWGYKLLLFCRGGASALPYVITSFLKKVIKIDFLQAPGQTGSDPLWRHSKQSSALWEHDSFTIQLPSDSGRFAYMCNYPTWLDKLPPTDKKRHIWDRTVSVICRAVSMTTLSMKAPKGVRGCSSACRYWVYRLQL